MSKALLEAAGFPGKRGLHFCSPVFSCQSSGGALNFSGPRLPLHPCGLTNPSWVEKGAQPRLLGSQRQRLRQKEDKRSRWFPQARPPCRRPGRSARGSGRRAPGAGPGTGRLQPHPGPGRPPGERAKALKTRRWRPWVQPADFGSWSRARGALRTLGGAEEVVNKAALAPRWRAGAGRPGLGSRSPTWPCTRTRTRTAGLRTRPGDSQESPGRCARGHGLPQRARPRARQLLERLDARPLAARAAADVAALVRRTGATLRLRPKAAASVMDSADIEVTDSRLPNPAFVEHRPQRHQSETLGTGTAPPQMTHTKACSASKPLQTAGQFCVELVRGSTGFGLTLSGGQDSAGDAPLAVRGLLRNGPAQRCGRLQAGDLVLHINGESTQGLTHAQVVERIRTGGPRLRLVLSRPFETHPGKPEGVGGPQKGDGLPSPDRSPDSGGPEVMRSRRDSASPLQHHQSGTVAQTQGSPEPSPELLVDCPVVSLPECCTDHPDDPTPGSPGPWLVPSEERLSRALGIPGAARLALEMASGRRRH